MDVFCRYFKDPAALTVLAAAAAIAIALVMLFRAEYLNTDTAQYVVTARHLLRGQGLTTSLIYFEQQMVTGGVPTPQTVWPPGYPALIAGLMMLGVPFVYAPFLLALLAHLLTSVVLYAVLRRIGCGTWLAAGGAVVWVATSLASVMVLRGLSETTYTFFTVLSAWFVAVASGSERRRSALMIAGAAAAAAFLIRYSGITFVAALGAVVAVAWLMERSAREWWTAVATMLIPVAVIAILFLRNHLLVGSISGGPSLDVTSSVSEVVRALFWSFEQMLGVFDRLGVLAGLLALLATCWVFIELVRVASQSSVDVVPNRSATTVAQLSFVYVALSVLLYGSMALNRPTELLVARYMLPLLPFLVIIFCTMIAVAARSIASPARRLALMAAAATVFLGFLAVQVHSVGYWREWIGGDRKFAVMIQAMTEPVGRGDVRGVIDRIAGANGPVLAVDGQLLGMWLDRPAIGLSEAAWTHKTWTADEVHEMVQKFGVKVVCEFPSTFNVAADVNRHRVFFIDLAQGRLPSWLRLAAETKSARVYEVIPAGSGIATARETGGD